MKLAIIILNYNQSNLTILCLASILYYTKGIDFKIFLVDNSDEISLKLSEYVVKYSNIDYIKNENNLGFTGGNNVGIRCALKEGFEYIALINNDTEFVDDSLVRTINKIRDSTIAICGLANYYFDNPTELWQAGLKYNLTKGSTKIITEFPVSQNILIPVDSIPGSSMIIKRSVFEKIGLLDSRFFAYYEDIEFCIRAKKNNFEVAFLSSSKILHKVGSSSNSVFKTYLRTRNMLLFNFKFGSHYSLIKNLLWFLKSSTILSLKNKNWKFIYAFILGCYDFIKKKFEKGSITKFH